MAKILIFFLLISTLVFMVACEKISLTFVVDTTHSMEDDIKQVTKLVDSIMESVIKEKGGLISNFILVTFNDPEKSKVRLNTVTPKEVTEFMSTLIVDGGDDCAELALSGVQVALESSLPGSYIYVLTDASAKDYNMNEKIQKLCQEKESQIVFIIALTGVCGNPNSQQFEVYYNISTGSSGTVIRVAMQDLESVVSRFVEEDIKGNKTGLVAQLIPPHKRTIVPFSIDELITHAVVSAAGTDVQLQIIQRPYLKIEHIVWTKHLKVVKVIAIKPGNFSVASKSSSATSVVVTGRSDFYFQIGFSKRKPNSLNDTVPQPFSATPTRLSLLVTDPNHLALIQSAQILNIDGSIIGEHSVEEISLNLYTTELFLAPSEMFKVAIIGQLVNTGLPVKRIAKITVIPQTQPPEAPEVTGVLNQEARVGSSVFIQCNVVKGAPKPTLTWQFKPTNGDEFSSINNSESMWHITNVTGEHAGDYRCTATNSEGEDTHVIQLTVKEPAKTSNNKTLRIPCDIFSYPKPDVKWDVNGFPVVPGEKYDIEDGDLIIKNPTADDNDNIYTCTVTKEFQTHVDEAPVDYSIIRNVHLLQNHTLKLSCSLPRIGSTSVTWYINNEDDGSYKPDINVDNAQVGDDGNYTCLVSDINGSATETFIVDVGYPPSFEFPTDTTISLTGGTNYVLRCDAIAKPPADVVWTLDGKTIEDAKSMQLSISQWGDYSCQVKNDHGAIHRDFIVE